MRIEADGMADKRQFQLTTILIILGLLSVVAIPRYMGTGREEQPEVQYGAAQSYIRALNNVLTAHTSNHYLRGEEWVEDGKELMELLAEGWKMPEGMRYVDNAWIDEKTGVRWEFSRASDQLPPRIRRVEQMPPAESLEMEPIGQGPPRSPPES
jgi:type II secretory pathway pseudopilin PulG